MGRLPKFDRRQMTSAALRLVADSGPDAFTVAALAKEIGAPTGSIYHRYESRAELLAELWMDVVESFQSSFAATLEKASDVEGAVAVSRFMLSYCCNHPLEARLLLLHRRQDFFEGQWPKALVERAAALEPQMGAALRSFAKRAFGRADADTMMRLRFALLDAPLGAIKPYLVANKPMPRGLDSMLETAARAVLGTIAPAHREEQP